jgi:prophage antirepressor-like protein
MTEVITDFYCKKCKKYYSSYQSLWIHNKKFHINTNNANKITDNTSNNTNNTSSNTSNNTNNIITNTSNNTNNIITNTSNNTNNIITNKRYYCTKCNRDFINYQNRWKHEKICKQKSDLINSDNKLEKIVNENIEIKKENCEIKNEKIEDFFISSKKAKLFLQNMLKELIKKNCKIHTKTLHKNNNDNITSDIELNQSNNELKSNDNINITSDNNIKFSNNELKSNNTKIIKSEDNKFQFDFNKNFLAFHNKPIKYFYYNDQVYFKGKDIASMLDYNDTTQAIRKNVDNDDIIIIGKLFEGGVWQTPPLKSEFFENEDPQTIFINESGFYTIIFASKKAEAIKFRKWVTSKVLPSIRKTGSYNLIDNYIEENLEKYHNKDCVYIIHIKDNIYKYGNTSHIFKRLQAHKTNFKYNKIIKIYDMNNINDAIKLEKKIKTLVKELNINIIYNTHVEIFKVDNNNLQNLIKKIDELSFKIINNKHKTNILETEKTKQLELENENLKLKLELFKLSNNNSS